MGLVIYGFSDIPSAFLLFTPSSFYFFKLATRSELKHFIAFHFSYTEGACSYEMYYIVIS